MNSCGTDKQERYFFYNSLAILLKAVEGEQTIVDLRNESSIYGLIKQVDGYMNIIMTDCVFTDPRGSSQKYEMFFVQARNIRYVHIPSHKKGYDSEYLKEPLTDKDLDFLQKGLVFDFDRGNIVKLSCEGNIYSASHGTKLLNKEEINKYYPNQEWKLGKELSKNPLVAWNGPLSLKIRTLLDCFDTAASVIFAKAVDAIDKKCGKILDRYKIWPDLLDGFTYMYSSEHLKENELNFYTELKANPGEYIYKCNPEIVTWLKKIKKKQKTFLITGSNSDFVEFITGYAFGEDLKSLFDIIICYAKKPGFFTENRPFYTLKNHLEDTAVTSNELKIGQIYSQGNWKGLLEFLSCITNLRNPRCLYVGDNLLQDIYAPSKFTNCHTLLISDEQLAETETHYALSHNDEKVINSKTWGSFFSLKTADGYMDTYWSYIIKKHSKICVPNIEVLCSLPLDEHIKCFKQDDDTELNGYYPEKPVTLLRSD